MKTSAPLRRRPLAMALAVGALIGVATPIAALELTHRASAGSQAPTAPLAGSAGIDAVDPVDAVAPVAPVADVDAVAEVAPVAFDGDWFVG